MGDLVEVGMTAAMALGSGGFALLLLGGGAYLLRDGIVTYRNGRHVATMDPTPVADLSPDQERVAVTGTAHAIESEGTISAPFSDDEAVVCRSEVYEKSRARRTRSRRRSSGSSHRTSKKNLHADLEAVPFRIEDDTGSVRVVPHEDAYYRIERETVSSYGDPRTEEIQEWIDRTGAVPDDAGGKRKYVQHLVEDGETAYVLAEPREIDADWGETPVELVGGDEPERMVVSDLESDEIASSSTWRAVGAAVVGGVLVLVGLPVLLFSFAFLLVLVATLL